MKSHQIFFDIFDSIAGFAKYRTVTAMFGTKFIVRSEIVSLDLRFRISEMCTKYYHARKTEPVAIRAHFAQDRS